VLTATGGGQKHALVVEHELRPLFGFFTALTLPTAVYASDQDFIDFRIDNPAVLDRSAAAADQLATVLDKGVASAAQITRGRSNTTHLGASPP
jgi:FMN reductase